jgi:hypothetical protein
LKNGVASLFSTTGLEDRMASLWKDLASAPHILAAAVGAAVLALAPSAAAMTFAKVSATETCAERTCVIATGEINGDTARDFIKFVKDQRIPRGAVVVLDSYGGNVVAALALGGQIRKAGLSTSVQKYDALRGRFVHGGECSSACAYVLLGGVERNVGRGARVGVHQIFSADARDPISVGDVQWFTNLLMGHIDRMGGEMGLLTLALRTPPQSMHWLTSAELDRFGVVTPAITVALAGD